MNNEELCKTILTKLEEFKKFYLSNGEYAWELGIMHGIMEAENVVYDVLIGENK